jgi:DNA-binding NarL/FixJ family response regulator
MSGTDRLMVVGDHALFRECLAATVSEVHEFTAVDQENDLTEALASIERARPDLMVVDLPPAEPKALERLVHITRTFPEIKVMIVGLAGLEVKSCLEAGVKGYVMKESTVDELREAVARALKGETVYSPRVAYAMFGRLADLAREGRRQERIEALVLTPRELEILGLVAEGFSNKEIADHLCLSIYTVKNHVHHALEKLEVRHRAEAVAYAYEKRWLKPGRSRPKAEPPPLVPRQAGRSWGERRR